MKKRLATSVTLASSVLLVNQAYAVDTGVIISGTGSIDKNSTTTTVNQLSDKLFVNWNDMNVSKDETLNFVQKDANAAVLNRITSVDPTTILGTLNANGRVFVVNPNGVLIGNSASINVGSLVASLPGAGLTNHVYIFRWANAKQHDADGTTDASRRLVGALVADNAGSAASGHNRVGAQLDINNPFGLGDHFQAIFYGAPAVIQSDHAGDGGNTLIGRMSYDLPVGARGARAGMAASRVDYTAGGLYRGYGFNGFANVYSLYASYPLIRSESKNLRLRAGIDDKRKTDAYAYFAQSNVRSARVFYAQLSGDRQGSLFGLRNALQYSASVSVGHLHNDLSWDPKGWTRGRYIKATQSFKLSQALGSRVYIDLSLHTQQASRNLDSSEKMPLGGPNAIRAYSVDRLSANSGYVASATIHTAVPGAHNLTALLFYDLSQSKIQKSVQQERNRVRMAGYGVGLNYVFAKRATLNLSYALPLGDNTLLKRQQHKPMLWVNTTIRF